MSPSPPSSSPGSLSPSRTGRPLWSPCSRPPPSPARSCRGRSAAANRCRPARRRSRCSRPTSTGAGRSPRQVVDLVRRLEPDLLAVQELRSGFDRRLRAAGIERYLPNSVVLLRMPGKPERRPGIGVYSSLPVSSLPGGVSTAGSRLAGAPAERAARPDRERPPADAAPRPHRQVAEHARQPAFGRLGRTLGPARRLQRDPRPGRPPGRARPRLPGRRVGHRRGARADLAGEQRAAAAADHDRPRARRPAARGLLLLGPRHRRHRPPGDLREALYPARGVEPLPASGAEPWLRARSGGGRSPGRSASAAPRAVPRGR